jgi:two-component system OmpR family response regulator
MDWQIGVMHANVAAMDYSSRILIVDDDEGIRALISEFLAKHGFVTETAADTAAMRQHLADGQFDLIVLDVMMPREDGLTALRSLGDDAPPVIMLSAVGSDIDRIVGLEMGAQDYLAKPCNPRELLARIRTVLRRTERRVAANGNEAPTAVARAMAAAVPAQAGDSLDFAGWRMDLGLRLLFGPADNVVTLSDGEFRLLRAFAEHPRRVLTRDQLLDWSRGESSDTFDRAIDVQLSRLRKKLADAGDHQSEELIRTIRNEGYVFTPLVTRRGAG